MNNKTADMYQRHWRERVRVSKAGHKGDVVPGSEIFEAAASALNGGGTLLDVGCGDGSFYPCISAKFEHVYGIDIAPEAVNEAQERGMEAVAGDAGGPLKSRQGRRAMISAESCRAIAGNRRDHGSLSECVSGQGDRDQETDNTAQHGSHVRMSFATASPREHR